MTVDTGMRLDHLFQKLFPDQYSGAILSNDNSIINIYETCSSPSMTRYAVAASPVGAVRFFYVPHTLRSLNRAFGVVRNDAMALQRQGVMLAGFGVDLHANLVNVQVVNLTRAQLPELGAVANLTLLQVHGIAPNQVAQPI